MHKLALALALVAACEDPPPRHQLFDVLDRQEVAEAHVVLYDIDPTNCAAALNVFCIWLEECATEEPWSVVGASTNLSWNNCQATLVPQDGGFMVDDPPDPPWQFGGCQADKHYDFTECLDALEHAECGWSKTRHVLQILDHCHDVER